MRLGIGKRRRSGLSRRQGARRWCTFFLALLASIDVAAAQDAAPEPAAAPVPTPVPTFAAGGGDVEQILPTSPVAGGNDPNASDDTLYILQQDEEDALEEAEDLRGVLKGAGPRAHVFVAPSGRVAAKRVVSPSVSIEAFVTSGIVDFKKAPQPFETRDSNVTGGLTSTADFGLVNGAFAYEHRQAFANTYATWASTGDKIGATLNKTLPFVLPNLTVTPQVLTSRETVVPIGGSVTSVDGSAGFTYKASDRLSFAASGGYGVNFLYALPGYRHNNGLRLSLGATYKVTEQIVATVGANTNRTILYGLPTYHADGSLSPSVNLRYAPVSFLSISLTSSYARFLSNIPNHGTFKYNINPGVSLTVPL